MQNSKRKFLVDSVIYTVLPKISFVAGIIILPLISAELTLNDFGIYGLILSFISIFQTIIVAGQNIVMQNAFFDFKTNYKLVWKRCFGLMIIAGLLSSALFCIISYPFLADKLGKNTLPVFFLVSLFLTLSPIDTFAMTYYILHQRSLPYARATAIGGFISQVIILITIKFFKLGYLGWVIALPSNYVVQYMLYTKELFIKENMLPVFKIKKNFLRNSLKFGAPLIPHQLSLYVLGTSDRLLLDIYKVNTSAIGLYNQGYGLGSYAGYLVNGIFQALSRFFHEGFRSEEKEAQLQLKKYIVFVPIIINILLAIVSLWLKEIYKFLYSKPSLQVGYPIAIVVMCSYMFWSLYALFTYPLVIQKKTQMIAGISASAAIINLIGNIIFIPKYGIWSAVITTYFGYIVFGAAGLLNKTITNAFKKYLNVSKFFFGIFILNIVLFASSYLLKDAPVYYKICVSLFLAGGLLFSFLLIKKKYGEPKF